MAINYVIQAEAELVDIDANPPTATVAGIRVFTANRNVLFAARTQGKLLPRINNAP